MKRYLLTLCLIFTPLLPVFGADPTPPERVMGVRYGWLARTMHEPHREYELFSSFQVDWPFGLHLDRIVRLYIDGSLAVVRGSEQEAVLSTAGPTAMFDVVGHLAFIALGTGATYLSKERFGNDNLGARLQFTSHIGAGVRVDSRMLVWYRIQHMSNGSLASPNPGVDMHTLSLAYRF